MRVGVAGCMGYTGFELVKLLDKHPNITSEVLTARVPDSVKKDPRFSLLLNDRTNPKISTLEDADFSSCELVFFATPHGVCMEHAKKLFNKGIAVIDLSADFRLHDPKLFEEWYGIQHSAPELLDEAVYGLPELNRANLAGANLVAMPGCYPTSVIIGVLPLIEEKCLIKTLLADCKSGVSGAGRSANSATIYGEVAENFKAYAVHGHRHLPEIKQEVARIINKFKEQSNSDNIEIQFTPHLLPMFRGLYSSIYVELTEDIEQDGLTELYKTRYAGEPFVRILPKGVLPETRFVRESNEIHLYVNKFEGSSYLNILVAEDNLIKGAAGQAIQVMNLVFGFAETSGLK
ncbi:MAG: N-acetyl-gamma-glutamyl-phosphate reductase [Burkholderiaceae bacterium]|nr:MAG: N-acetyl-gamma-glutamyl-phosphate reductase [Burkholderiaceae bacterium]